MAKTKVACGLFRGKDDALDNLFILKKRRADPVINEQHSGTYALRTFSHDIHRRLKVFRPSLPLNFSIHLDSFEYY